MKTRQAKKIMARYATLKGNSRYWLPRWNTYTLNSVFVTRYNRGDHRIRKAIAVCEKRNRKFLKNG